MNLLYFRETRARQRTRRVICVPFPSQSPVTGVPCGRTAVGRRFRFLTSGILTTVTIATDGTTATSIPRWIAAGDGIRKTTRRSGRPVGRPDGGVQRGIP